MDVGALVGAILVALLWLGICYGISFLLSPMLAVNFDMSRGDMGRFLTLALFVLGFIKAHIFEKQVRGVFNKIDISEPEDHRRIHPGETDYQRASRVNQWKMFSVVLGLFYLPRLALDMLSHAFSPKEEIEDIENGPGR